MAYNFRNYYESTSNTSQMNIRLDKPEHLFRESEAVRKHIHMCKSWHGCAIRTHDAVDLFLRSLLAARVHEHSHDKPKPVVSVPASNAEPRTFC